jgi:hypothetical protein
MAGAWFSAGKRLDEAGEAVLIARTLPTALRLVLALAVSLGGLRPTRRSAPGRLSPHGKVALVPSPGTAARTDGATSVGHG